MLSDHGFLQLQETHYRHQKDKRRAGRLHSWSMGYLVLDLMPFLDSCVQKSFYTLTSMTM